MSYICTTNVCNMKKNSQAKKSKPYTQKDKLSKLSEPEITYRSGKALPQVKEFTYHEFKKIAEKAPFTQSEWAAILHISERTLQRYAKDNSTFAPINAERATQIAQVLKEGELTFGNTDKFYQWLKGNPYMLEGNLSFGSLTSYEGIQKVLTQLGRIQHGLFA